MSSMVQIATTVVQAAHLHSYGTFIATSILAFACLHMLHVGIHRSTCGKLWFGNICNRK